MEPIERVVRAWPGVAVASHRFGGREFTVDGVEFGHVHGDRQVDVPFVKRLRDALVESGQTSKHHLFPDSGWVTYYLDESTPADSVDHAVWLLRLSYLSQVAVRRRRATAAPELRAVDVAAALDDLSPTPEPAVRAVFDSLLRDRRSGTEPAA